MLIRWLFSISNVEWIMSHEFNEWIVIHIADENYQNHPEAVWSKTALGLIAVSGGRCYLLLEERISRKIFFFYILLLNISVHWNLIKIVIIHCLTIMSYFLWSGQKISLMLICVVVNINLTSKDCFLHLSVNNISWVMKWLLKA